MSLTPPFLLLDRYDVSAQIGRGGHAIVYRAHDRVFDRAVAIKLLRDDALSPDVLARFRQEIQVTARLEHAHILHVYDTGTFEGLPFVVMELASGQTLADRLAREGPLPVADALQITRDVGLALAHAHARGIVHRDVKPENILLGSGGAMLADFGVARVTADQAVQRLTSTGMAVGTLQYMSPEQLCAEPVVDARSDQYALACVLYEMLAGVRPHVSASLEGLRLLRLTAQHAPVSVHRPSVPAAVEEALQVALAVAPADRFRDVEALLAALGEAHTGDLAVVGGTGSGARRSGARSGRGMTPVAGVPVAKQSWMRPLIGGGGLIAVAVGGWALNALDRTGNPPPSDLAIVVTSATDSLSQRISRQLKDELTRWESGSRATSIALSAQPDGDSLSLRIAALTDGAGARVMRIGRRDSTTLATTLREVAGQMYSGAPTLDLPDMRAYAGRSTRAVQAFGIGMARMQRAQFDSASAAFAAALHVDPTFDGADYWRALASYWSAPTAAASWRPPRAAAASRDTLLARRASALAATMDMQFEVACPAWRDAVEQAPHRFDAWYLYARCMQLDSMVSHTPSGLQFRQGSWATLQAFGKAMERAPSAVLLHRLMGPIWRASFAGGSEVRAGRSADGQLRFYAMPGVIDDSLSVLPVRAEVFAIGGRDAVPDSWSPALRRGRRTMLEFTSAWTRRSPNAPEAWWHYARALELSGRVQAKGDGEAGDALTRAAVLRTGPLRADMDAMEIRLALRRGDLQDAAALARAYLAASDEGVSPGGPLSRRIALAALIGDFAWIRRQRPEPISGGQLPLALDEALARLMVLAQIGDCEGARRTRADVDRLLGTVAPAQRSEVANTWLRSALRSAVPCLGAKALLDHVPVAPMDSVYRALAIGDDRRARRALAAVRQRRTGANVAALTWDYIFAEAWTLAATGDSSAAVAHLVAGLDDLAGMSIYTIEDPGQAAGLRRALALLLSARGRNNPTSSEYTRFWEERARQFLQAR